MSQEAQELKEKVAKEQGIEVDEIIRISKDGKDYKRWPYYEQRKVLNYLVDCIYENNKDIYSSREKAMDLFFKSYFDGNLPRIAKPIEKTFGKGAFERIGAMTGEGESANHLMNYLIKKHRHEQ